MAHYKKGADAERELIHMLFEKGFSVVRVAGSGKTSLPAPDILALTPQKKIAFECKAWSKKNLNIEAAQMAELVGWAERAGTELFVAWKVPHKGWLFLPPKALSKTPKGHSISLKNALKCALNFNVVSGSQKQLRPRDDV